ncbi:MAG: glucosyl transferase [Verrucomicrobiota bacterium JB025]|nr:glucosyl transferase [Verrucomicrobiota bacterium JB025]
MDGSLVFFAHERGDARVRKRIAAFGDLGWVVTGFTFHRERDKVDAEPAWENVHLGTTFNRRYVQRLFALAGSVGVLWRERRRLADAGVIYAVNVDNALLALLGRWFSGGRAPVVLELADIQPAMTGGGLLARGLRGVERFVLGRVGLLVTTSPGFVREYFEPVQGFAGEVFLLENKVYPSAGLPQARVGDGGGNPWVVGYFGAFRCRRSLVLMRELAQRLGGKVRFVLRGYAAGTIADEFDELVGGVEHLEFGGAYGYPDELAEMYGGVDLNWAFDESDPNGNSAWLLPNRIYEGGCFGVPVIAGEATETGRWIEENGVGWTFAEPLEESLAEFFGGLERDEWLGVKERCMAKGREEFTGEADYAALSARMRELARA